MTIRRDDEKKELTISIDALATREEIREKLLVDLINEDCGQKTRYFVENCASGERIYLERPARLNKGCDFIIYVENLIVHKNGNDKPIAHVDLFSDLVGKKNALSTTEYEILLDSIKDVFECRPYVTCASKTANLPAVVGWSYELLLKIIRWFFAEQDITYWAYTGREMLFNKIKSV